MRLVYKAACLATAGILGGGIVAPSVATAAAKPCSSYAYVGGGSLCADFPGSADVDCPDVKYRVRLLGEADPWRLDGESDGTKGIGCESYPVKPKATPSPKPSPTASKKPKPKPKPSQSHAAVGGEEQLPKTGAPAAAAAAVGAAIVAVGVAALVAGRRRRKVRFQA